MKLDRKLQLKIFVIFFSSSLLLGCLLSVVIEYAMQLGTKEEIRIAEQIAKEEAERQAAIEAENRYQEEQHQKALDYYDEVGEYINGIARVKKNNKYGYINEKVELVIALDFDMASDFDERNYAKVMENEKMGYIDMSGQAIIPVEYDYCGDVFYGMVTVGLEGKYGFFNIDGRKICNLVYDEVTDFDENGIARVVFEGKQGYINKKGDFKEEIVEKNDNNE